VERAVTRGRKILLAAVVAVLLLMLGVVVYFRPIAPVATGYAAKIVCSAVFVSERHLDDAADDLPANPLVPFLRISDDAADGTVRATLLGLAPSTAFHTPGLGCTLADERPAFDAPQPLPPPDPGVPWPDGEGPAELPTDVDGPTLEAAIDVAFVEDDPDGRRRNTRAVVVVKGGELVAERYGDGFDAQTPLLGWSMGKSIANAIVGRLVADGRLALDDADLRADWTGDQRATITLQHLLTMTDGLDFDEVYEPGTDATQMLFTAGSTADFAAAKELAADPGTRWNYSSGTTNILCDVAQRAAGAGPELARDLVFEPLGMTSGRLEPDETGGLVCSSFPYATARDYARFGQWFLQDGEWDGEQLLPDGWVKASTTPVDVPSEAPYGAQWWLNQGPDGQLRMPSVPADAFWASGTEGQQIVVVPSEDLVVVRLGFSGEFSGIAWGLEPMLAGIVEATSGTAR
jgi:CubicO group peptidase (beta-lactamase class C family)